MNRRGFTIVELLIVIVVIAILAAISVVAYNGIQDRTLISRSLSELQAVNKAIQLYHSQNGTYPTTGGAIRNSNDNPADYVPGLTPDIVASIPVSYVGTSGNSGAYLYRSTGTEYKLIAHSGKYAEVCTKVKASYPERIDPSRDCWAYGYWSPGGSGL